MKSRDDGARTGDAVTRDVLPKHTPGPWTVLSAPFGISIAQDARIVDIDRGARPRDIACVFTGGTPTAQEEANARLIAAAPELLAEHERNATMFERLDMMLAGSGFSPNGAARKAIDAAYRATKKVIAKAEGCE